MPDDFSYYLYVGELPEVRAQIYSMRADYLAHGNSAAANAITAAYDRHVAALTNLAFDISIAGTEILRRNERTSRVRPDTQGRGGPRLGDSLFSDPLSFEGLPGSVGIANLSILNANVPWWSTNEEGSSARVGRVFGIFNPGGVPADPLESRVHPLFQPFKTGYPMTIRNPIPARRFVEHSIPEIRTLWRDGFVALKAALVAEVAAAGAL